MSLYTDKETLTRNEFLALERLLWLARRKYEQVQELVQEMRVITGENDKAPEDRWSGHSMDAVFEDYDTMGLLGKLDLKVGKK